MSIDRDALALVIDAAARWAMNHDERGMEAEGDKIRTAIGAVLPTVNAERIQHSTNPAFAGLIANDADADGTPHWKYRVRPTDVWSAGSCPTEGEAILARALKTWTPEPAPLTLPGFDVEQTGGGCTALVRRAQAVADVWRGGKGRPGDSYEWLVTRRDDPSAPDETDTAFDLGLYDENGQRIAFWQPDSVDMLRAITGGAV